MDNESKFTEVKQARRVNFLNLRHNSEHVDDVISGTGRPQLNKIFRFLKLNKKIAFYPNRKIFSPKLIAWNVGSDGKIKILTTWALYKDKILQSMQRHVLADKILQTPSWPIWDECTTAWRTCSSHTRSLTGDEQVSWKGTSSCKRHVKWIVTASTNLNETDGVYMETKYMKGLVNIYIFKSITVTNFFGKLFIL